MNLGDAIKQERVELVKKKLKAGDDPNDKDLWPRPIEECVSTGNTAIAELLLAHGANALHMANLANSKGNAFLVRLALDNLNHKGVSWNKETLMHNATEQTLPVLIEYGCSPLGFDGQYETPLEAQIKRKNEDIAIHLLALGANPNAKGTNGLKDLPFVYAVSFKMYRLMWSFIRAGADIEAENFQSNETVFDRSVRAAINNHDEFCVHYLFEIRRRQTAKKKISSSSRQINLFGQSFGVIGPRKKKLCSGLEIDEAIRRAGEETANGGEIAKIAGPDGIALDPKKVRQLLKSEQLVSSEVAVSQMRSNLDEGKDISWLLALGVDPDGISDFRGSPLQSVASKSNGNELMLVGQLLAAGASVNGKESRNSPLMCAAESESANYPLIDLLLRAGADPNHRGYRGQTAIMLAAIEGFADRIEVLAKAQGDINASDEDGWTALHHAADEGHAEVIRLLITLGADINRVESKTGATALILACKGGHHDAVATLVQAGADLEIRAADGLSVYDYAEDSDPGFVDFLNEQVASRERESIGAGIPEKNLRPKTVHRMEGKTPNKGSTKTKVKV